MSITVSLLGTPRVMLDGQELVFPYRKAAGFFYYLCVKRSVSRDEAIGIFWADCAEAAARKNLRDAIYHLKKLLGEDVISVEGNNRIRLRREMIAAIDYEELTEETLFEGYTGDFLGFFYIKNCMEFEDWATEIREEFLRRYQKSAEQRVDQLILGGDVQSLIGCAGALLRKRIFQEPLYRKLLGGLMQNGGFAEAEQLYQKLKISLMDELGTEPEEETRQLMQEAARRKADHRKEKKKTRSAEYFFGREQEMMTLLTNLRSFETGGAATSMLLTGEAGVGKSAILRKLRESLSEDRYLQISYQCVQTEEELYLKPWNDILAQVEGYCRTFHITFGGTPDFYAKKMDVSLFVTQYEMYAQSMLQMLAGNRSDRKIVLLIDDIQWMDNTSKRLLSNLMFWAQNEKLLIILTSRVDCEERLMALKAPLITKGLLREIMIPRFTMEETKKIIRDRKPDLLTQEGFLEQIYHNTDGNALFLLEFLKELEHGGNASQLSPKTTGMIQSRLLDLNQEERELLNSISLYPRLATIEDLQILSPEPKIQILKSLERLLSRQLICLTSTYNKQGYGFSHQLIRDYIYNNLLEDKRRVLHALVAEYYEKQFGTTEDIRLCPMLIYHFSRCQNIYKTYTYRLEYLRAFYAVQHEIYPTLLTGATENDPKMPPLDGEDELVTLAEQIRALHQWDPEVDPLRMKVEFLIGRYDLFSGSFKKGLKNIQISIAMAKKRNDSKYLMENYLQMIFHAIQIHNLRMFHDYITACEQLLERYPYSEADICTVLRLRGVYDMKNYQYEKAEKIFQEVIRRTEPLYRVDSSYCVGLAACYNYVGEGRQAVGKLDEALEYYLRAIEVCKGKHVVNGVGVFYSNAGYVLYQQNKLDQAQAYIDEANQCFAERGALWGRAKARAYAALLAIKRGEWENAQDHVRVARQIAQRGGNPAALSLVGEVEKLLRENREERQKQPEQTQIQ